MAARRSVRRATVTGGSVYELVLQKGWLTKEAFDDILCPEKMTHPRQLPREEAAAGARMN